MQDWSSLDLFEDCSTAIASSIHAAPMEVPRLQDYVELIVFFSGGKDSVACALRLLELGIPAHRIELHHHLVDGAEGSTLMDWPVTEAYCKAVAKHFGFRYAQSWRLHGLEGELLRHNAQTRPVAVPMADGSYAHIGGSRSKFSTRRKFPQVTADLSQRWCSASVKIDVGSRYLCAVPRFADGRKRLVVTGERAQESASRAHYKVFEPHRSDNRGGRRVNRWLDHWRPVHGWSECDVWGILERFRVCAHPAYYLGFGRASCRNCIFNGPNQWATMRVIDPRGYGQIAAYEEAFGITIHRSRSVCEQADRGTPLPGTTTQWAAVAMGKTFDLSVTVDPWRLPAGAFGDSCGPS